MLYFARDNILTRPYVLVGEIKCGKEHHTQIAARLVTKNFFGKKYAKSNLLPYFFR
jgi:hypothetical protein